MMAGQRVLGKCRIPARPGPSPGLSLTNPVPWATNLSASAPSFPIK